MPSRNADSSKRRSRPTVISSVPSDDADAQPTVHVGRRLRVCRVQRKLTQEQAAGAAGLTRNALGRLEAQQFPNPSLRTLVALMQVYELGSLEELLGPLPSYRLANSWEDAGWTGPRRESS